MMSAAKLDPDSLRRLEAVLERTGGASPDGERLAALSAAERILSKAAMRMSDLVRATVGASNSNSSRERENLKRAIRAESRVAELEKQIREMKRSASSSAPRKDNWAHDSIWELQDLCARLLAHLRLIEKRGLVNHWELEFSASIQDQIMSRRSLTGRQREKLVEVASRYGIRVQKKDH